MGPYLASRASRCLILASVALCVFAVAAVSVSDSFTVARLDPLVPPASLQLLRGQSGNDHSLLARSASWIASLLHGEWRSSLSYDVNVGSLLWSRLRNTLLLTATATVLAWLIAAPVGVWLAVTGRMRSRPLGRSSLSLLLATPDVVVVLVLQFVAARTGIFPLPGTSSLAAAPPDLWSASRDLSRHLALPVAALVLSSLRVIVLQSGSAVAETLATPFIRSARANGIPARRLLYRHALPAAAHPLISLVGLSACALLSGSILAEGALGWPGLGKLMLEATRQRDADMVVAVLTLSAALLLVGRLVSDLMLYAADPRLRRE